MLEEAEEKQEDAGFEDFTDQDLPEAEAKTVMVADVVNVNNPFGDDDDGFGDFGEQVQALEPVSVQTES